jgi:hypothetical protein
MNPCRRRIELAIAAEPVHPAKMTCRYGTMVTLAP